MTTYTIPNNSFGSSTYRYTISSMVFLLLLCSCKTFTPGSISVENNTISSKQENLTQSQLKNWNKTDPLIDTIPGMSVDRAYTELIKDKKGETVIVAIIDTGVDIEHEDLRENIWINTDEIEGNKKDDDGNGYIDDIHGWNFLGTSENENLEYVRMLKKNNLKLTTQEVSADELSVNKDLQAEYENEYQAVSAKKKQYEQLLKQLMDAHGVIAKQIGREEYSSQDLIALQGSDDALNRHIGFLSQMYNYIDEGQNITHFINNIEEGIHHTEEQLNYHLNLEFNGRKDIGDNVDDIADLVYGNNNVIGPNTDKKGSFHGTHVAGIVGAVRNNNKGVDGIAQNIQLMIIRAVPNGDEYDKDIALAIRYAIDNGAKVINASFGKYYSTHPEWVQESMVYAAKKDVLIVHAAGNEGVNIDDKKIFPNDQYDQRQEDREICDNFMTVGAVNYVYGDHFVAGFSNYGKKNVDVFAPGVKIFSTTPNDTYGYLQGTSLAAPAVSGIGAVIRSYYPSLRASEVKQVIMDSGIAIPQPSQVGDDTPEQGKKFNELSKSGKIVNLFNALLLAEKMVLTRMPN